MYNTVLSRSALAQAIPTKAVLSFRTGGHVDLSFPTGDHAGMRIAVEQAVQHCLAKDEGKSVMNPCESSCTALTSEVAETQNESSKAFHRNLSLHEPQSGFYLPMKLCALPSRAVPSCQQAGILEVQSLIAYGSGMLQ